MPSDADVIGVMQGQNASPAFDFLNTQKGDSLLQEAQKQYPYLADKDIVYKYTPDITEERQLEFVRPDETERPEFFPQGKIGIQVFNPSVKPIDILADYVSHHGVENDPQLMQFYQQFQDVTSPEQMANRYAFHKENLGENRDQSEWQRMTGMPELFRGYTFKQFGPEEEAKSYYTPQQLEILDKVRSYLNVK